MRADGLTDGETDGHRDMTKLIATLRNFAKATKNYCCRHRRRILAQDPPTYENNHDLLRNPGLKCNDFFPSE